MNVQTTILFINRVSFFGGAERVLLQCMELARANGYRAVLACPGEGQFPDMVREAGLEVIPCEFSSLKNTIHPVKLARYIGSIVREGRRVETICRNENVSLLHAHGPIAAVYGARAAGKLRIPMLVHMHDVLPVKLPYVVACRRAAKFATSFLCVSLAVQRRMVEMGIPPLQLEVLYNGVDRSFLSGEPPQPIVLAGSGPHIAIVAQILPLKGQHVFLEAAKLLVHRLPQARFYVVGGVPSADEQPYLDRLLAKSVKAPLRDRVRFTGYQADVRRWLAAMDVVALCSVVEEALPLVPLEAMALGRRVIGTNLGGTAEIIEHQINGLLVPANDPAALAEAIITLTTSAADEMGANAVSRVRTHFSPEKFESALSAAYSEALREGSQVPS